MLQFGARKFEMSAKPEHLNEPVVKYARKDFPLLGHDWTVEHALEVIRQEGVGEKIIYFYVVDDKARLAGVLPTRRLLTAPVGTRLKDVMITRVVKIPHTATVLEACEMFVMHKFFAFPVVDGDGHVEGVVDVTLFAEEVFDIAEREQMEGVFEAIGFRASQVRGASPWKAFRYRFPWLLATIASGTVCAVLAGLFEATLAKSLIIAFFLTLVLALGESVSIQSMTVTIQALRLTQPTVRWYLDSLRREVPTAAMLGAACGVVVGLIVWLWRGAAMSALTIGGSIVASVTLACVFGLSIPFVLHALKLDPKIAAGPITLAVADVCTLLIYLLLATWLLGAA
jgi:magnesium transporter